MKRKEHPASHQKTREEAKNDNFIKFNKSKERLKLFKDFKGLSFIISITPTNTVESFVISHRISVST